MHYFVSEFIFSDWLLKTTVSRSAPKMMPCPVAQGAPQREVGASKEDVFCFALFFQSRALAHLAEREDPFPFRM